MFRAAGSFSSSGVRLSAAAARRGAPAKAPTPSAINNARRAFNFMTAAPALLRRSRRRGNLVAAQLAPIRQNRAHERAAGLAIAHRMDGDLDLVTGLEGVALPALAADEIGAATLDRPFHDLARGVGDIQLYPGVRIAPLELLHHPLQHD